MIVERASSHQPRYLDIVPFWRVVVLGILVAELDDFDAVASQLDCNEGDMSWFYRHDEYDAGR